MTYNNVQGNMFTSKINGNKIFLPFAGWYDDDYDYHYRDGWYWSNTREKTVGVNDRYLHYYLNISTNSAYVNYEIESLFGTYKPWRYRYSIRLIHD